jgi:hypothetical protein
MTSNGGPLGDLRRSRRLDVGSLVGGRLVPSGAPIKIRDIGFGGFAIETSAAIRVGSIVDIRLTSKDGSTFLLKAAVVHSREVSSTTGPLVYVSGLEFADTQASTEQRADVLIDKVNWILSFYDQAWRDASGHSESEPAQPDVRPSTRSRPRLRPGRTLE